MNRSPSIIFALAAFVALGLSGCRDAARPLIPIPTMGVTSETARLVRRIIAPQETDPDIDWAPAVNPQFNHHFVWLDPGPGQPPYDGTHILVTDLEPRAGYATPNPHLSTVVDPFTPVGPDGAPLLRDGWRYMLGDRVT